MGYYRKLCCVVSWKKLAELKFEIGQEVRTGKRRKSNWFPVVSGVEYRIVRGDVNEGLGVIEVVEVVRKRNTRKVSKSRLTRLAGFALYI